jgi:hypothetical protein
MRSGGVSDALRAPAPGQEFVDALGGMIRQAGQHVGELSLWIEVVELGRGDEGDSTWVHRTTGEKRARHACLIKFVDKLWQPLNCKLVDEVRSEWQVYT